MNKVFVILFFALALSIIGCAGNSNTNNKLSGTLYVAGNEPFTYLALDTKDRTIYKIECSDSLKKEMWQLQGQTIELNYTEMIVLLNTENVVTLKNNTHFIEYISCHCKHKTISSKVKKRQELFRKVFKPKR